MTLSREARLVSGVTLLAVPTVMYGGWMLRWLARICAPAAAVAMSAGLFGVAFLPGFRWVLYAGAICLVVSLVLTGVGLLRNR